MALQESFSKSGNFLFKYRSFLPIIILVPGLSWFIWLKYNNLWLTPWWLDFCFLIVGLCGQTIRILTVGFTPKGTSGRNTTKGQIAEQLNTSGIYSTVRHPLYLGNFFMWLAPILMILDFWAILFFCVVYWLYYERIMCAEEDFLRKKFGEETYLAWANKTPAFVPSFKNYKKSILKFSVKNVLKREYNGFFNMVLIMTILRVISYAVTEHKFYLDLPWLIIFDIGLIIFLTLKILKKFTHILDVSGR